MDCYQINCSRSGFDFVRYVFRLRSQIHARKLAVLKMEKLQVTYRSVEDLIPYARNARTHSEEQVSRIASSIKEFGWTNPILVDGDNGVIAGHGRLQAARKLKLEKVPVIELAGLTETQKRAYILADNKLALDAGWDEELLKIELEELKLEGVDLDDIGFSDAELNDLLDPDGGGIGEESSSDEVFSLNERFIISPLSIFRTTSAVWQDRKRKWLSIGIKSEIGRDEELTFSQSSQPLSVCNKKKEYEKRVGHDVSWEEFAEANPDVKLLSTTSIFDPVLCEIGYKWFSPSGGVIVDPFAGGSVRGIVASLCGRQYFGVDLREEQVSANREQAKEILGDGNKHPIWVVGDSSNIDSHLKDVEADLIFSCPPYADLERYSDNPKDLSTMEYEDFVRAYKEIIKRTASLLKPNRFAVFVVGEVRSKGGSYYGFVKDTISAFEEAGLDFYNEIILENPIGSAALRCSKYFNASRKVAKIHQNVLVFVKGEPKEATKVCGTVDIAEPDIE